MSLEAYWWRLPTSRRAIWGLHPANRYGKENEADAFLAPASFVFLSRGRWTIWPQLFAFVFACPEEVRHDFGAVVAGMVQAWKAETGFERLQQGKVGVEVRALDAVDAIVRIHDEHNLVRIRRIAVIVFVPHQHDSVAAFFPCWRALNGLNEIAHGEIALVNQPWV